MAEKLLELKEYLKSKRVEINYWIDGLCYEEGMVRRNNGSFIEVEETISAEFGFHGKWLYFQSNEKNFFKAVESIENNIKTVVEIIELAAALGSVLPEEFLHLQKEFSKTIQ